MAQNKQIEFPFTIAGFCNGASFADCKVYRGRGRPRNLRLWEICVRPDLLECGWPLSAREIDKPYISGVFCNTGRGIRDTHPDETAEGGKGHCGPVDHWEICENAPWDKEGGPE